jgi:hypothetical protein
MNKELLDLAISYLSGWKTMYDYADWLAGIDWNNPGLEPDYESFAGLSELLIMEISEGLRLESDLIKEASNFVASKTKRMMYVVSTTAQGFTQSSCSTNLTPYTVLISA